MGDSQRIDPKGNQPIQALGDAITLAKASVFPQDEMASCSDRMPRMFTVQINQTLFRQLGHPE